MVSILLNRHLIDQMVYMPVITRAYISMALMF